MYRSNDKYSALLTSGYTVGQNVLYVSAVPTNVPTIIVAAKGTDNETVFAVTGKTTNSLTGVSRLRGANVNLDTNTPLTCLNNEEFINGIITAMLAEHNEDGVHSYLTDGWIADPDTWVYVSASSFKVVGKDVTSRLIPGTKIKLTQTSAKYFYVTSASFSTDTTVNVTGGTAYQYALADADITSPYYSYSLNPQGFPASGLSFTPTISVTSDCGTFSNVKFQITGNMVMYKGRISYAKALASGNLTLSLPVDIIYSLIPIGFAHFFDAGVADKRAFVHTPSTSTIDFYLTDGSSSFTGTYVNSSAWSSSDVLDWVCFYPWRN